MPLPSGSALCASVMMLDTLTEPDGMELFTLCVRVVLLRVEDSSVCAVRAPDVDRSGLLRPPRRQTAEEAPEARPFGATRVTALAAAAASTSPVAGARWATICLPTPAAGVGVPWKWLRCPCTAVAPASGVSRALCGTSPSSSPRQPTLPPNDSRGGPEPPGMLVERSPEPRAGLPVECDVCAAAAAAAVPDVAEAPAAAMPGGRGVNCRLGVRPSGQLEEGDADATAAAPLEVQVEMGGKPRPATAAVNAALMTPLDPDTEAVATEAVGAGTAAVEVVDVCDTLVVSTAMASSHALEHCEQVDSDASASASASAASRDVGEMTSTADSRPSARQMAAGEGGKLTLCKPAARRARARCESAAWLRGAAATQGWRCTSRSVSRRLGSTTRSRFSRSSAPRLREEANPHARISVMSSPEAMNW
mmetsp:Transcript_27015/g.86856  ORF Transcript_27015/g.86856 Transcript_27015/m.86856 type:complete len:421 (-) Transcript_27015:362-1624(-)